MNKRPNEIGFGWIIPANGKDAGLVVNRLIQLLEEASWPKEDIFSVHTALVEAVNNALEHGNCFDEQKNIYLSGQLLPKKLIVQVRDEGNGFNVTERNPLNNDPSPLSKRGRGIFLIRHLMSKVHFNESGNELTMEKVVEPALAGEI